MSATRRRPRRSATARRAPPRGSRTWLAWTLGALAIAASAWLLLAREPTAPPPLDEIDDASRARLEAVLREAERAERPSR